jgi:hypothetical protein
VTLERWGIFQGGRNPVARSNVCPEIDPPPEPSFYAFSFTTQDPAPAPSFVVAGSGEAQEGAARYSERTVRFGETTPDAMREKAAYVLGEMERRMALLGFSWADATAAQVYTVHDIHPFLGDEIVRRGAARGGLTWHYCRPPVHGLEYEMDCRGIADEHIA